MKTLLLLVPLVLAGGQARYARLGEFTGAVEVQLSAAEPWMAAQRNLPLPQGAWIRTGADARVEIELDDGSVWRLGADSQGELSDYTRLSTGQYVTLVSLDRGLAYFTGQPGGKDALSLAVPGAQVVYNRRARVRLDAGDHSSGISILEGSARFSSPAAEIDLKQGATARVEPAHPDRFFLDRELKAAALDRWSADRDKALAGSISGAHAAERYGLADLDNAGQWLDTEAYGTVWKPKPEDGWAPFQNGRWRWYDGLGYTWVSGEAWGWLPYHYGRWARWGGLGWIWVPAVSQVFKPGDVYWLRGESLAGWGPLAPGEQWAPPGRPDQFLNVNTTFAAFAPEMRVIDPAGFSARPKDPLAAAAFALALPSPAFPASRLDATRPVLRAGSTRITPLLRGVSYEDPAGDFPQPPPQMPPRAAPPRPPVTIASPPAANPEQVAVPVPAPYPVLAGLFVPTAPAKSMSNVLASKPPAAAPGSVHASSPAPSPPAAPRRPKRWRDRAEGEIYNRVLAEMDRPDRQLADLESWTHLYRDSDFADDRSVLYMHAYSRLGHAAEVVRLGADLMDRGILTLGMEPREILSVFYLTTASADRIPHPNDGQRRAFRAASEALLHYVPVFFAAERKPAEVTESDWRGARVYLESAARKVLAQTP